MAYEFDQEQAFELQTKAYQLIDKANAESFLMNEESEIQVIGSLHSAGASREALSSGYEDAFSEEVLEKARSIGRELLVGNVSPKGAPNNYGPSWMTSEERVEDAGNNIHRFFKAHDIDPAHVRMMRPERDYTTPLSVVDLDEEPIGVDELHIPTPDKPGDFMYTFNPDLALAARPADCPLVFVSAETPKGHVQVLLHLATLGVAHDYIEQSKVALDSLGVDWETVRAQITPGVHADTYNYTNSPSNPKDAFPAHAEMYVNFEKALDENGVQKINKDGQKLYNYDIELSAYVYNHLIEVWGIDSYQVFADTTNTPSPTSGTSSNSRARKGYEVDGDNTRDVYVGRRRRA